DLLGGGAGAHLQPHVEAMRGTALELPALGDVPADLDDRPGHRVDHARRVLAHHGEDELVARRAGRRGALGEGECAAHGPSLGSGGGAPRHLRGDVHHRRPVRHSAEGHQMTFPRSSASAGTSRVRTTKVSSSTPKATMNAIWARKRIGITPSAAKVAASTMPAEVITPPVTARPRTTPSRVPWARDSSRTRVMRKML